MPSSNDIADYLDARQGQILERWEESVIRDRDSPSFTKQKRELLLDHFPILLKNLVQLLRADNQATRSILYGAMAAGEAEPGEHAKLRFEAGYSIQDILRELTHLRQVLMQELYPAGLGQDLDSSLLIHSSIDNLASMVAQVLSEWQSQLLNAVVMQTDRGIIVVSNTGAFLVFNAAAEKIVGRKAGEMKIEEWLPTLDIRGADGIPLSTEQMPFFRAFHGERVAGTYRVRGSGDVELCLEITATPLEGVRGTRLGAAILFRDVTEQKAASETLEQVAAFREQFIGILAHDLRNPLTAIRGYTELALGNEDAPLPQFRNVAITVFSKIDIAARRIQRLIDDVLDFTYSRLGGGIPLKLEPVNLVAVCNAVVDEMRVLFPERVLNIELLGNPVGHWDPGRLMQVFSNLITNAIKYSPRDSVICVVVKDEGENVRFSVLNMGEAIPREQLDRIFEPFKRLDTDALKRSPSGLGLGLFIVRSIVEAHRGTVEVKSMEGIGTTFTVKLPKAPSA